MRKCCLVFIGGIRKGNCGRTGIFCETVGNVSEDKLLEYVENQGSTLQ